MKLFYQKKSSINLFVLFLFFQFSVCGTALAFEPKPSLSAASAVLVDGRSGEVLMSKDPYARRPMASTTKIMTAVIALERLKLRDVVTVSRRANQVGESEVYLEPGEKMSVENLLYGMLVKSGNDAAYALSEKIGGSESIFTQLMNKKAEDLGLRDIHFENCDGLPANNHYSSALDLAKLGVYAMKNPIFRKIVATKVKYLPWPGKPWRRVLENRNHLLWRYSYCNGIKTGFTEDSGRCLVASATKDGSNLISAVLKSQDSFEDSKRILQWGFRNFRFFNLIEKGKVYSQLELPYGLTGRLNLAAKENVWKQVPVDSTLSWTKIIFYPKVELPVRKGQVFGRVAVYRDDEMIASSPLVCEKAVKMPHWGYRLNYNLRILKKRLINKFGALPVIRSLQSL